MPRSTDNGTRREREGMADLTAQLAGIEKMTVGELAERYRELYDEPTRSRNKAHLRKKLAWRIQELAEGGLSQRALERIQELAATAPPRWRSSRTGESSNGADGDNAQSNHRDPRIPPPGTILRRDYEGATHEVVVLQDGFEFRGQQYPNLSRIARIITGTNWNGFLFWGLQRRATKGSRE